MFELESFVPDGMMNTYPIWSRDAKRHWPSARSRKKTFLKHPCLDPMNFLWQLDFWPWVEPWMPLFVLVSWSKEKWVYIYFRSCDDIVDTGIFIRLPYTHILLFLKTLHFEYISEAVSSGIMSVQLQTQMPVVYGVLNCLNEDQVKARSSGDNNHGYDWGKTAVEMALLRMEALNIKAGTTDKLSALGFSKPTPLEVGKKPAPGFF